jgi:hypothetical protein
MLPLMTFESQCTEGAVASSTKKCQDDEKWHYQNTNEPGKIHFKLYALAADPSSDVGTHEYATVTCVVELRRTSLGTKRQGPENAAEGGGRDGAPIIDQSYMQPQAQDQGLDDGRCYDLTPSFRGFEAGIKRKI